MERGEPHVVVENLDLAYGDRVIQRDLAFTVRRGEIFVVMGGNGCGKTTLLRHLVGLHRPARGLIRFDGVSLWDLPPHERERLMRRMGVLYQGGALWSSMTLAENVALPLELYTSLGPDDIREVVSVKLALAGLAGFEDYYPSALSGGMRKRAGLARAMALNPDILYFDEPSAGLDPITARRLDDLIVQLRDSLGTTIVVVTHDLASIFAVGTDSVMLDAESRTMIAGGDPRRLLAESRDPRVRRFLTRGEEGGGGGAE